MYEYTKAHRLKKTDEFSSVFIFRKVRFGRYFKIHFKPNELFNSRLGIIVSKKIAKRANCRNYMKRFIREEFRHAAAKWSNFDVIVRVQKSFNAENAQEVHEEFSYLTKILCLGRDADNLVKRDL